LCLLVTLGTLLLIFEGVGSKLEILVFSGGILSVSRVTGEILPGGRGGQVTAWKGQRGRTIGGGNRTKTITHAC
jgi:hypothetical protein